MCVLGPVHTNADSKVYGFVLPKTNQLTHVHTSTKDIRFYPLSRAFPSLYGFGGCDLIRVRVLVWTEGLNVSKSIRIWIRFTKTHQLTRVHTSTKDIRICLYPLSRVFQNSYGFGGSNPRVSVDGRPKRIKKYTNSNKSTLVWTGP